MLQAHLESAHSLILIPWFSFFDGLFQPMHLLVIGIIAFLLFGKRLPEFARFLGKRMVEFRLRRLYRSLRKIVSGFGRWLRRDDEEPGACPARLTPPDKPRPPAQVALTPPKPPED